MKIEIIKIFVKNYTLVYYRYFIMNMYYRKKKKQIININKILLLAK